MPLQIHPDGVVVSDSRTFSEHATLLYKNNYMPEATDMLCSCQGLSVKTIQYLEN